MSIRLNGSGAYLAIDLGTSFDIDITTTAFTVGMWIKKINNFVDYDPFVSFSAASNSRTNSIETENNGTSGATGTFEGGINGGGRALGSPSLSVGTWYYVAFTRPAGTDSFSNQFYAGTSGALSNPGGAQAHTTTGPYRYLHVGELAQTGLVTSFDGEVAQLRLWSSELTEAQLEAESASATPVITSGLVMNQRWLSTTDTDQGPNAIAWTSSGSISNGASDPPPGGGASGSLVMPTFYPPPNYMITR